MKLIESCAFARNKSGFTEEGRKVIEDKEHAIFFDAKSFRKIPGRTHVPVCVPQMSNHRDKNI